MAARTTVTLTANAPADLAASLGLASSDQQAGDVLSLPHSDALALVTRGVARFGSAAEDAAATPTVVEGAAFVPAGSVGQSAASLPADWSVAMSLASFLDTPAMGTLKTLGSPANSLETEYGGALPVVQDDGTIVCAALAPAVGATGTLWAASVAGTVGTWAATNNALGAPDTNRTTFTSAVANDVGSIDLAYDLSSVPAGAPVTSVVVTPNGFASSDSVMPFTVELVNASGVHVGSAAQSGNAGTARTFTGITYADVAAGLRVRVKVTHANNTTSGTVSLDGASVAVNYSAPQYRSEIIFTSDRTDGANDYTVMRFHAGDRIRLAFDVLGWGLNGQDSNAWNSIFQSLGRALNGSFPSSPFALLVENKKWVLRGGQAITVAEPPTSSTTYEDGRWYRWEFDILLGAPGAGKVNAWCDGIQLATDWLPPSGTFYAGNGNTAIDLDWIYFKVGLYGGATSGAYVPKAVFRNRRFSATVGGATTTWRGPHTAPPGMKVYRRNPVTDMPY